MADTRRSSPGMGSGAATKRVGETASATTIPAGADNGGVDAISAAYQAGLIKRVRPTRAQTAHLRESLYQIVDESKPTGIRFVYYRAVARGLVEKSDGGYDKVQYALKQLRENGTIPWGWIVDSSRWVRRPRTFDDAADALTDMARGYVRNIWSDADAVVEVWCESKSAAGVLAPVTFKWGVDLFPITGQTSDSFAYEAAQDHLLDHRPLRALYVGDLDPAGVEIELNLLQKLRRFGRGDLGFTRLACTPDQVIEYDLIGTTPKKPTYKNTITGERLPWHGMAYEVEGIDAPVLRDVVEEAIVSHLDPFRLDVHRMVEAQELAGLRAMANGWSV